MGPGKHVKHFPWDRFDSDQILTVQRYECTRFFNRSFSVSNASCASNTF